jgi:hypothetical protein
MFMVPEREVTRDLRAADRIIVPFVSNEVTTGFVHISRPDEIHAWVEVWVEFALVVAGVAGVLAGMVGR